VRSDIEIRRKSLLSGRMTLVKRGKRPVARITHIARPPPQHEKIEKKDGIADSPIRQNPPINPLRL